MLYIYIYIYLFFFFFSYLSICFIFIYIYFFFFFSFLAVEEMRRGATPTEAATTAVRRIAEHYPTFSGAVIAINKDGEYGAACNRVNNGFQYYVANPELGRATMHLANCINTEYDVIQS